jgi:diguanylate cyclase (GGDEF)-like protein
MFTSSIFTLMAVFIAYRQEFQRRRTYLLTLRHVLLNSDLLLRNEHLRDLADRDELTGLLNRRGVRDIMAGMVDGSRKEDLTYGVMLLDIDEFKAYNDYYGHLAGDECLRQVAEEYRNALRETDLAARFGGEEFLAVLPSQDLVGCLRAADNVRSRIQKRGLPHLARRPGAPPCVTVSIGVACTRPGQSLSFNDLVQAADEQLYRAKEHGRNAVFPLVAV